jgi:acetyl esterase/lipase
VASSEFHDLIEQLRCQPPLESPTVEQLRAGTDMMTGMFPLAPDVHWEAVQADRVRAEWISTPGAAKDRAILYLHGGGYVAGSIPGHRELVSRLSRASGAFALAVDYRLAPEHPFPAALEDSFAAYRWLVASGVAPSKIVIAGDDAGGGLTVSTLVALRDAEVLLPAAGICLSPWVDLEGLGESMILAAELDPVVRWSLLQVCAKAYLAGMDPHVPLVAPLHADLSRLPPLLIQVGTSETLYDDSVRLAERARRAGVDVVLEPWEEMVHVWQLFAAILPEGRQAIARAGDFIRERTA